MSFLLTVLLLVWFNIEFDKHSLKLTMGLAAEVDRKDLLQPSKGWLPLKFDGMPPFAITPGDPMIRVIIVCEPSYTGRSRSLSDSVSGPSPLLAFLATAAEVLARVEWILFLQKQDYFIGT